MTCYDKMNNNEILQSLNELQITKDNESLFYKHEYVLKWIDDVAPLLKYNNEHYSTFMNAANIVKVPRISSRTAIPCLNIMKSAVNRAIIELESDITETKPTRQTIRKEVTNKGRDWDNKPYGKIIIGVIIGIILLITGLIFKYSFDSASIEQHTEGNRSPNIVADGDVNVNYGAPPDVVNRLLEVIDKKDVDIAERDAKIRELIEKDKEREEALAFLEKEKRKIYEGAKANQNERLTGIATSTVTLTTKDKISQTLDNHKKLLEQTKIEKQYSFDDWYYKGAAEFKDRNYPTAITSFTKALKVLENVQNEAAKAYTYNYRGTTFLRLDRLEEALADYDMAIELNIPKHELPYYNKGVIDYINFGQYEEAQINLNKAIVVNPKHTDSYLFLSEINMIEGDYESALDTINKLFSSRDKGVPFQVKTEDAAMLFYVRCLASKLLNKDTSHYETELNKIFKLDFTISQNFDLFTSWLKDADFDDETMAFIKEKTELFKQKQTGYH